METDASSLFVGAVLAQKKEDGKINPIQYASRTMKSSECKYSVFERETLAVIHALKKFRGHLLLAILLKLITDQQGLSYAFREKYISSRLARRLEFLSEYDFTVEYHRRSANSAPDSLSRNHPKTGDKLTCQEK